MKTLNRNREAFTSCLGSRWAAGRRASRGRVPLARRLGGWLWADDQTTVVESGPATPLNAATAAPFDSAATVERLRKLDRLAADVHASGALPGGRAPGRMAASRRDAIAVLSTFVSLGLAEHPRLRVARLDRAGGLRPTHT